MLKIQGGDFCPGSASLASGTLTLTSLGKPPTTERIAAHRLSSLEMITAEGGGRNVAVARALVGSLVFGPVAGLAALAALRSKQKVTFVARLDDGRHFVATGDPQAFAELKAASTGANRASRIDRIEDRSAELSAARAAELVGRYKAQMEPMPSEGPQDPRARAPRSRVVFGKR